MTSTRTLLEEDNLVSLRTAYVLDDGYSVFFGLTPRWLTTSVPELRNYGKSDSTLLYRRRRSFFAKVLLLGLGDTQKQLTQSLLSVKQGWWKKWTEYLAYRSLLVSMEKDVRVMVFTASPKLKLLWADSGQSVALFLNGEPWAFIHEEKNHGYSKGILKPTTGNPWDQELFEKTFLK